jgi:hypothetical protein
MTNTSNKLILSICCLFVFIAVCSSKSPPVDPNCVMYKGTKCLHCSYQYYFGKNGICTPINPLCLSFDSRARVCRACYPGYALVHGQCIAEISDPNCQ